MLLSPPWLYFDGNTSMQASAGYHFFLCRPKVSTYEEMFGLADDEVLTTKFVRVKLNGIRLMTQLSITFFLITGFALRFGEQRSWAYGIHFAISMLFGGLLMLLC